MPAGISPEAAAVWDVLGPFALEKGTLTAGTATAFEMLCRAVVLERALGASRDAGQASHRGMMQRVEAGFARFSLVANGKPMAQPAPKAVDPFAEFDEARG